MSKFILSFSGFKNRFNKERFSVGLDIGTHSAKLVRLRFTKENIEVCDFIVEPVIVDTAAVLKKILSAQESKNINIAVSGPTTIIRYVNFPRMSGEELMHSMKFEAQKHIPFPVSEVNIDTYVLKEDLPDNKMLVMLAAVKKEALNQRLKLLEGIGYRPNIVDIDSLALVNAFNHNYKSEDDKIKTVALLNIGATETNLNILEGGLPRLSRDIHIAGNNFTKKIQDSHGLDFKSAEELKLNPEANTKPQEMQNDIAGGPNPDKVKIDNVSAVLEPVLAGLATEVRTSFDYYESQNASSVAKIFLSGGGSMSAGLKDLLTNLLGIEIQYWDPLKALNIAANVDSQKIKVLSSQLNVAVGLALRGQGS